MAINDQAHSLPPAMIVRTPWDGFPPITVHTQRATLKEHPAYPDALHGDAAAARRVVADFFQPGLVKVKADYVVPVQRLNPDGRWSPLAMEFARLAAKTIGARVLPLVIQDNVISDVPPHNVAQITAQPSFTGTVPKGDYLIVNDSVNLGSTFANLRGYIEHRRGHVILATSLTANLFASKLAPDSPIISSLQRQFKHGLAVFPEVLGFPPTQLTQREAHFCLGLKNLECLRNPLLPTHNQIRPAF